MHEWEQKEKARREQKRELRQEDHRRSGRGSKGRSASRNGSSEKVVEGARAGVGAEREHRRSRMGSRSEWNEWIGSEWSRSRSKIWKSDKIELEIVFDF